MVRIVVEVVVVYVEPVVVADDRVDRDLSQALVEVERILELREAVRDGVRSPKIYDADRMVRAAAALRVPTLLVRGKVSDVVSKTHRAPSAWHVIRAIALRELGIARRRRIVKFLFLASLVPPFVFGMILVGRVVIHQTGMDMGWDPVLYFLMTQALPVALLALGLGTPAYPTSR